jgi:hypothetical protein
MGVGGLQTAVHRYACGVFVRLLHGVGTAVGV